MPTPTRPLRALVTGASRGIGATIAATLAARGVRVAVHYHANKEAGARVHGALAGDGHALVCADLADPAATIAMWDEIAARMGPVDVVVNNAGVYLDHPPLTSHFADWQDAWRRTLATNLVGPANLCLLAAQTMAGRPEPVSPAFGRGRIVNVSSRGAFRGEPDAPAYCASKAGLNGLSQSLARALAPNAIYVYCIAPGWVETEMASTHLAGPAGPSIIGQHPLGRVNRADEVADAVAYCALEAPAAMTGGVIDVNGASYLRT